jgi:glycosyltransferase involved in cell wall biosynthesis
VKILYVASYDVSDLKSGNGIDHFKLEALRAAGCEVKRLSPIILKPQSRDIVSRGIRKLRRMLTSGDNVTRKKQHLETIGNAIATHPFHAEADVIVSPNHFDISFYRGSLPIVFWTDATYSNMVSMYPNYQNETERMKSFEHLIQKRAIDRAIGAMWASRYAMNSAISDYGADPDRQIVSRFGLNLPTSIQEAELEEIRSRRDYQAIRLMFIGFDYKRKGLDIALRAVVELNTLGIPALLDTIGGFHEVPEEARKYVTVHGPLNKLEPRQLATFEAIQRSSHFLIFPTRADVYCMPAIEAMAAGCVPVVSNVGGIPEIVTNGETGIVLPLSAGPLDYAKSIKNAFENKQQYLAMCRAGYASYQANHQWDKIGEMAVSFIKSRLNSTN